LALLTEKLNGFAMNSQQEIKMDVLIKYDSGIYTGTAPVVYNAYNNGKSRATSDAFSQ
jgi:hypothetical protein